MEKFRQAFEVLAAPLKGISNEVLESTFVNGLRLEIIVEIHLLGPKGLGQIMDIAQEVKDRIG